MGLPVRGMVMTAAEFLAWEALQDERHDFVNGEIFAMAGAEDRHVTVSGNLYLALRRHLAGTPCRAFIADMKVLCEASSSFFYPDVVVTCSATDRADRLVKREPTLIIEVLSPGTAAYDRGEKFAHYRRIPALKELALVDLESRRTDVYSKGDDGLWVLHPFEVGADVTLASMGLTITAAELFAEVDESPPASDQGTANA